ncbi:MAG: hypothetical protein IAE97_01670 [Chthoniobacterales bacterium]|nr:hypothetical protein [Chthoniobacterales bacterium]
MTSILRIALGPLIRHSLTVLSGVLVARGLPALDGGTVANLSDLALAGVTALTAVGWSIGEKKARK